MWKKGGAMGIFYRRPLCLGCFLFLFFSLVARKVENDLLFWSITVLAGVMAVLFLAGIFFRRLKRIFTPLTLCVIVILLTFLHSFLTVDLPLKRAETYVGEQKAICLVLSEKSESDYGAKYLVKLQQIGSDAVSIRATLTVGFAVDVDPGDRIYARVQLCSASKEQYGNGEGSLLLVYADSPEDAYIQRLSEDTSFFRILFSDSGVRIISERVRKALNNRLEEYLGEEIGALAGGFFMGYRSDISPQINRDFQRSGTSHQMAVSGMHISVLLGSVEFLLRKIFVPKRIRYIIVTLLSFLFLILTGFSMSACRSVFMLYAVYLTFMFFEENDGQTSLFASVAVIVLISPYAATDLGLIMSFFATLGLLTVYPLCEQGIPFPRLRNQLGNQVLRILRYVCLSVLMTVISNLFLLPVMWIFFQEFSLISVASNLILSPFAYIFLLGIPILLIFGWLPWIGEVLCSVIGWVGDRIVQIIRFFSELPAATVSLKYTFAGVIILLFTGTMIVLLVIRLRRKWILAVPPFLAVAAFALCFFIFHAVQDTATVIYTTDGKGSEQLVVTEGSTITFVDQSSGSGESFLMIREELERSNSTEISALVLTHYHHQHVSGVDWLIRQTMLRELYLPMPENATDTEIARALWQIATECGTEVIVYQENETISLSDSVKARVAWEIYDGDTAAMITLATVHTKVTYLTPSILQTTLFDATEERMKQSEIIFIGYHGPNPISTYYFDIRDAEIPRDLIYTSADIWQYGKGQSGDASVHIPKEANQAYRLAFDIPIE